jgi:4-diphosphocytidyl-2-C-methyl-D-erythritol kinase
MILNSPSKINLGLNVVSKRRDGFHNIETIFLPLMLCDIINFNKSDDLKFNTDSTFLNKLSDNLILKAIILLESYTNRKLSVEIFVRKMIPIGGGLGGGSSNAAVALKAINKIFDLDLNIEILSKLALKLGSDVPYFLNPVICFAESRGEIIHPLFIEVPYPILIVNPRIKIDTSWAFKKIIPSKPVISLKEMLSQGISDLDKLKKHVKNDFEDIVFREYPEIKQIKKDLYNQGAKFALMSGTGSTIYGIFSNLQKAAWAKEFFDEKYFTYLNNPFTKDSIT